MRRNYIKLLAALALVGGILAVYFAMAYRPATASGLPARITITEPLRLSLPRPTRTPFYLDIDVSAFTPPRTGAVEAIVELEDPPGSALEIGRFAPFPAEVFSTDDPATWRGFRFDANAIVGATPVDRPLTVVIRLKPLGIPSEADAAANITIARVAFADGS